MKCFGVPAVLQKHILSRRFVWPAKLAVVIKHFLSGIKQDATLPAAASARSGIPQDLNPRPARPSEFLAG